MGEKLLTEGLILRLFFGIFQSLRWNQKSKLN